MKDKSKKSTYSTTFGVDPGFGVYPKSFKIWGKAQLKKEAASY